MFLESALMMPVVTWGAPRIALPLGLFLLPLMKQRIHYLIIIAVLYPFLLTCCMRHILYLYAYLRFLPSSGTRVAGCNASGSWGIRTAHAATGSAWGCGGGKRSRNRKVKRCHFLVLSGEGWGGGVVGSLHYYHYYARNVQEVASPAKPLCFGGPRLSTNETG